MTVLFRSDAEMHSTIEKAKINRARELEKALRYLVKAIDKWDRTDDDLDLIAACEKVRPLIERD